jgi:hypothetical protein
MSRSDRSNLLLALTGLFFFAVLIIPVGALTVAVYSVSGSAGSVFLLIVLAAFLFAWVWAWKAPIKGV